MTKRIRRFVVTIEEITEDRTIPVAHQQPLPLQTRDGETWEAMTKRLDRERRQQQQAQHDQTR